MIDDITAYMLGKSDELPVRIVDALEAGLVAMALDEARISGKRIDMTNTWAEFNEFKLRA